METALRAMVSATLIATGLLTTVAGVYAAFGKMDINKAADLIPSLSHKESVVIIK